MIDLTRVENVTVEVTIDDEVHGIRISRYSTEDAMISLLKDLFQGLMYKLELHEDYKVVIERRSHADA